MEEETKKEVKENKKEKKNKEIELLKEQNSLLNEKILRVTAEMQNMKRRYEDEISRIYKYEGESAFKELLNVIDNFERAINMDDDNKDDEVSKFLNGFILIYKDLIKILNDNGIKEIECLNKEFNPNYMNAVMMESVEGIDAGIVTCILQKGYMYNDKCLRPVMVKVSE